MTSQTQGRHSNNSIPALSYRETHGEQGHILGLHLFCFFVVVVPYACDMLITTSFTFIYRAQRVIFFFFITIQYLDCVAGAGFVRVEREISRLYSTLTTLPTSSRTLPPPSRGENRLGGRVRLHISSVDTDPSSV